jgi:hypothetical protein
MQFATERFTEICGYMPFPAFDVIGQLLFRYSAFFRYYVGNWSEMQQHISYFYMCEERLRLSYEGGFV